MKNMYSSFAIYFFVLLGVAISVTIAKFLNREKEYQTERIVNADNHYDIDTVFLENIRISVYHPSVGQTDTNPLLTADGSIIDTENPQRWIAVSKKLLEIFPYGSTLYVVCDVAPIINGSYEVHDTGCSEGVDILIANPIICDLRGCWKGNIYKIDTLY